MELKDVILSTLAEMDDTALQQETVQVLDEQHVESVQPPATVPTDVSEQRDISDEAHYLQSVKERLLVLFEGFQSPNNVQIEAKVDLTLNFLEYLLSTIDTRLDSLKKHG